MDETNLHKRKRKKNLTVLLLILGWILLIWLITMVRIAQAQDLPAPETARVHGSVTHLAQLEAEEPPFALDHLFSGQRRNHQNATDQSAENMEARGAAHQATIGDSAEAFDAGRRSHQQANTARAAQYERAGTAHMEERTVAHEAWMDKAATHQDGLDQAQQSWWANWKDRVLPDDYGPPAE